MEIDCSAKKEDLFKVLELAVKGRLEEARKEARSLRGRYVSQQHYFDTIDSFLTREVEKGRAVIDLIHRAEGLHRTCLRQYTYSNSAEKKRGLEQSIEALADIKEFLRNYKGATEIP